MKLESDVRDSPERAEALVLAVAGNERFEARTRAARILLDHGRIEAAATLIQGSDRAATDQNRRTRRMRHMTHARILIELGDRDRAAYQLDCATDWGGEDVESKLLRRLLNER